MKKILVALFCLKVIDIVIASCPDVKSVADFDFEKVKKNIFK